MTDAIGFFIIAGFVLIVAVLLVVPPLFIAGVVWLGSAHWSLLPYDAWLYSQISWAAIFFVWWAFNLVNKLGRNS